MSGAAASVEHMNSVKALARLRSTAVACVALVVLAAGCSSASVAPLPKPPKVSVLPTTTSLPDFSGTSLPAVAGTQAPRPVELTGGAAVLHGVVTSGGQPVPGATVRIERFLDDRIAGTYLTTQNDGTYTVDHLLGGRFRVRAFRPPDEALTDAQIFFLGGDENRTLDLSLQKASGGTFLSASISPDAPILGQQATITISLTTRTVDGNGVVRSMPIVGTPVYLQTQGGRAVVGINPTVTGVNGRAEWDIACTSVENQGASVNLNDGSSFAVNVSPCRLPPTTTTIAPVGELQPLPSQ